MRTLMTHARIGMSCDIRRRVRPASDGSEQDPSEVSGVDWFEVEMGRGALDLDLEKHFLDGFENSRTDGF